MVGILYESDEWSDWKLKSELEDALNEPVAMINMEEDDCVIKAQECELLISRVFASAPFRGHTRSHPNMDRVLEKAQALGIPVANHPQAHAFEISKARAACEMQRAGLAVPRVQGLGSPKQLRPENWEYPCIIKPDCGGRTTHTAVLQNVVKAQAFLESAPDLVYIVEDYVTARAGFMTRAEIVDGEPVLVLKRSIAPNGLSSYHEGSVYAPYPECDENVLKALRKAAEVLSIQFGSFDVIEGRDSQCYMIDANSVSNVSEDCTELFNGFDLMREYARALARKVRRMRANHERGTPYDDH